MKTRLGQTEGKAVAILILVIAVFIIMYMIIIPPEERNQLLGEKNGSDSSTVIWDDYTELLSEIVGKLTPKDEMSTSHSVSTVNIYHKNQPKIVPLTNSLLVSNGWFIESFPILAFNLENKQNIDKISLYFNTIKSDGTLKIKLNDNPVMEENIQEGIKIIDLPKTNLQEKDNKLEFKTSFPFWIWSTNDYQLKDVGVKINYELVNTKEERTFVLAEDEKSNIKSARLEYYQQCNSDTKGQKYPLKIYINDKKLFDGNILCIEGRIAHEVSLTNLLAG